MECLNCKKSISIDFIKTDTGDKQVSIKKFCSKKCLDEYYDKKRIRVNLTYKPNEYNLFAQQAKQFNLPLATYLKKRISTNKFVEPKHSIECDKLRAELGKIGSNFNQIARVLNTLERDNRISKIDISQLRTWLSRHEQEFKKIDQILTANDDSKHSK